MSAPARPGARRRAPSALDPHSATFSSFSDALYAGVLIFGFSLLIVTWFAAFSAGTQVLREARERDGHITFGGFWRAFVDRVTKHWVIHIVVPAIVTALLAFDVLVMPYVVDDAMISMVVPVALGAVAGAIALRIAGAWRVGTPARVTLSTAWARMSMDAAGSLLLALAVITAGSIVAVMPVLAVAIPGPLALAAVAMDRTPKEPE